MSEAKRYSDLDVWKALHFGENDSGWVKWEDYARLKAEVEKWEKNTQLMGRQLNDELEQVARLKAEVERLTKAGDAMAEPLEKGEMRTIGYFLAMDWNAAKKGGQS